jgi:hypothetical protein
MQGAHQGIIDLYRKSGLSNTTFSEDHQLVQRHLSRHDGDKSCLVEGRTDRDENGNASVICRGVKATPAARFPCRQEN